MKKDDTCDDFGRAYISCKKRTGVPGVIAKPRP